MSDLDRRIELERRDAARQALEAAAVRLEQQQGNSTYVQAWTKAARIIRAMKPISEMLNDKPPQISLTVDAR